MRLLPLISLATALSLSSCSLFESEPPPEQKPKTEEEFKTELDPFLASGQKENAENYNVTTSEELAKIDNGAEGEVFFTNPDDPDQEIGGITEAFENKKQGQLWIANYGDGLRIARRKGLPILIWFHDSAISPKSKELGSKLLNTKQFLDWCKDRVTCICLDSGAGMQEDQSNQSARNSSRYINSLQQRYKLRKKPAFVVLSNNGKVMLSIDGYEGFPAGLVRDIKDAIGLADKDFEVYKEGLKSKGYRLWTSTDGESELFAKVTRFDQKKDILYLREYTGKQLRVHESKFCNDDVDYVENKLRTGGPKY